MAIDEVNVRLRHRLEEMLGVDEAALLMDRRAGGWSDLATKDDLEQRFAAQDARFDLKLEALEHKLVGVVHQQVGVLQQQFGAVQQQFGGLRHEVHQEIGALRQELHQELRAQTWRLLTAVLASMSVLTAVFGLVVIVATS